MARKAKRWCGSAAVGMFLCTSAPAAAQNLMALCSGSSSNGQAVSRLFTLEDGHYGYRGAGQHAEDVSSYGQRFKIPMLIANYGPRTLSAQFDARIRAEPKGHNGGQCVVSTDRQLLLGRYFELKTKGYDKTLLNDWRPTQGTVLKAEEWPN